MTTTAGISAEAVAQPVGWFNPWNDPHGYQQVAKEYEGDEGTVPLYSRETVATLAAEVEALRRERDNLQASLTARANSMLKLRDSLAHVHDNIEDEGDRSYFGSTNDADTFKDAWQDLDGWAWDDIMADGKLPDVYEASRKAHARADSLAAELAQCREALGDMVRLVDELADNALQQGLSGTITWDRVAGAADMFNRQDAARTALKGTSHEPGASLKAGRIFPGRYDGVYGGVSVHAVASVDEHSRLTWCAGPPRAKPGDYLYWIGIQK